MTKRDNTTRNRHIKNVIISLIILIFLVVSVIFIFPSHKDYSLSINNCSNVTQTYWDMNNLEILISQENITTSFNLAGLETTDFQTIFNYLNKDGSYAEDICWGISSTCVYNKIGKFYQSQQSSLDIPIQRFLDNYIKYYGYMPNLNYTGITSINITGDNIRVEGQSVRNLNGDHNNIFISFGLNKYKVGIKTENISVCSEVQINDTKIINQLEENNFKDCQCTENCTSDKCDTPTKKFFRGIYKGQSDDCFSYSCDNYIVKVNNLK
jgi:hypothetical protein